MAVTAKWYTNGPKHAVTDTNWLSDTIRVYLLGSGYTPDQDAHEFLSAVIAQELATANGYTAGGVALGTKTVTVDTTTNQTRLGAANTLWTPSAGQTLTANYAVVAKATGTNSTSPLLGYIDFGGAQSAQGDNFTLAWDPTGILRITAS